jgi:hypothetical protein
VPVPVAADRRWVRKKIFSLVIVLFLLALIASPVLAQDYSFQLTSEVVTALINTNGTATIDYTFNFSNHSGAHPIDYVDVGMPNSQYDIHSITADVNGKRITDIQPSPVVKLGVALGLGPLSIPAGESGTVHCHIGTVNAILHPGTQKESQPYASFQFSPTWFDSNYVSGSTDLTVNLVLPVTNDQDARFYPPKPWPGSASPDSGFDPSRHLFYRWQTSQANSSTQYIFGAAFPAGLVPASSIVQPSTFNFGAWLNDNWGLLLAFGAIIITALSFICPTLVTIIIFGVVVWLVVWLLRRQKLQYLPPIVSIEGNGIKRGLTAVEAAILLEQPMDKILTMILFSVVKKNAASVIRRNPLQIAAIQPQPDGLQAYDIDFVNAFKIAAPEAQCQALQDLMVTLVKGVSEKMKGFSGKETMAYYQDIIKRAWDQVESAGTPDVKSQLFGENIEWAMLDHHYADHTHRVFDAGPVFLPLWWGNYDPGFHQASVSLPAAPSGLSAGGEQSSPLSLPTLPGGAFAASVVNGVQSFSAGIIGDITSFTAGVTARTNPAPVGTSSSSGSSFHHSSSSSHHSCACACAGCACACAGGGR